MSSRVCVVFQGISEEVIAATIAKYLPGRDAFVSPLINNWVVVFDADCDSTFENEREQHLIELCSTICKKCNCSGLALVFYYGFLRAHWIVDATGQVVDRFATDSPVAITAERFRKIANALSVHLEDEATKVACDKQLDDIGTSYIGAHVQVLWKLYGIANLGWSYSRIIWQLDQIHDAEIPQFDTIIGWNRFLHVGCADPRGTN